MHDHTRHLVLASLVLVGLVGGAAVGAAPVAAQEETDEPNPIDDLLHDEETSMDDENGSAVSWVFDKAGAGKDFAVTALAGFEGSAERVYQSFTIGDSPSNDENAAEYTQAVNTNSDTLADGLNTHTTPDESWNTTRVVFKGSEGDDAAVYVLTHIDSNGTIDRVEAANQTTRSVDHTAVVDGLAAEDADDIVADASDAIRSGDPLVDEIDRAEMTGKYCSKRDMVLTRNVSTSCDVSATFWMDQSELPEYDIEE